MNIIKFAVLSSLFATSGLLSGQAMAAGFVTLPTSGTSAYVTCRSGNGLQNTYPPLADSACVAPNGVGTSLSINISPEAGFTLGAGTAFTTSISAFSETLGTLNERVWRNTPITQCIYAKQVAQASGVTHDYNAYVSGVNGMQFNDIAFGGYTGAVSAGYAKVWVSDSSVIRIGRTFTSVQLQWATNTTPCPGFLLNPLIGGVLGTEINGVGLASPCSVVPTPAQQSAQPSLRWVDFTLGSPSITPLSPIMYIKQACSNTTTSPVANSLKLRQTGSGYAPWVVVNAVSRAPSINIAP